MQGCEHDQTRRFTEAPRNLHGVWIAYTMQNSTEVVCGEIVEATSMGSGMSNSGTVKVMTMFTRRPPTIVAFPLVDILSPYSVFVFLGTRPQFEWLHIGAYVKSTSAAVNGMHAYDRIRDIFDGFVFFTHSAPVSLRTILSQWKPVAGSDKIQALADVEARHARCSTCKGAQLNPIANTRPSPPTPTTDRQVVDEVQPGEINAWTKIMD